MQTNGPKGDQIPMIKKFGLFILLYVISLLPWVPQHIAPNHVYEDLIWLSGAILSIILLSALLGYSNQARLSQATVWDSTWKRYASPGFIIGLLAFSFYFLVRWLLGLFTIENSLAFIELLPIVSMTFVYTLYIAITEEIIFRGYILSAMRESLSLKHSILISLGLFVLAHLPKLHYLLHSPYAIHLIAAGLVFTYAYVKTGSIWLSIGLHWGWNMGSFSEERTLILNNKIMGSWADPLSWIYILVDLLLLLLIIKLYGGKKHNIGSRSL
jgi:membrane protease YdiL (CAAX protease family)